MQKNNFKFEKYKLTDSLVGEARLVFKEEVPPAPTTAEKAPEKPKTASPMLEALGTQIQDSKRQEVQEKTGIDIDALKNETNPDNLDSAMQKLCSAFGKMTDSLLSLFGFKPEAKEYLDAPPREPVGKQIKVEPPKTEGWIGRKNGQKYETLSNGNISRFEDAELKLSRNPTWLELIKKASASQNNAISEGTIVAFIEMESGFNPNARPIDPRTKEPDQRVFGMAQARSAAIKDYTKDGHPGADLMNPETAIDFVAWYCVVIMQRVNNSIQADMARPESERRGFKGEYALNGNDAKNLYLAYNQGAEGYLLLRRYKDPTNTQEQTEKYKNELKGWQKRTRTVKGQVMFESEYAMNYTARDVGKLADAYDALHTNDNMTVDCQPIKGKFRLTSEAGVRIHPILHVPKLHNGVDLAADEGTPVVAVKSGKIELTSANARSGNFIIIRHDDGSVTEYLHLSAVAVSAGETVTKGQEIGKVGSTGVSTGPHLHFIYKDPNGNFKNPEAAVLSARQA